MTEMYYEWPQVMNKSVLDLNKTRKLDSCLPRPSRTIRLLCPGHGLPNQPPEKAPSKGNTMDMATGTQPGLRKHKNSPHITYHAATF